MRIMHHALMLGMLALAMVRSLHADTLAAKRYIVDHYVTPLPDSIVHLPWDDFAKHVDEYTRILSRRELRQWWQRFAGATEGETGIDYEWAPLGWQITEIAPQSPAYYVDIRPGDVVTSVNGRAPRWRAPDGSYASYSGRPGSWFLFEIMRGDTCLTLPVQLADYKTESVYVTVIGRTLCVVVLDFNHGVHKRFTELTKHIRELEIDTIILDLRRNAGGSVNEALSMLSEFIPIGDTLLCEQMRHGRLYRLGMLNGRWWQPRPLYVLQGHGTVSAGEIFTGGMLIRTNAVLIGANTYGKGRIQRFVDSTSASSFADSLIGGLKYTVALYNVGGTLPIDSIGVPPDMRVDLALPPTVSIPASIDVVDLRIRYRYPTQQIVDSVNRLAGGDVSHQIWCERSRTLHAWRAIDTLRARLPHKAPRYRPDMMVDRLYMQADEKAIRTAIREDFGHVLDGFTLDMGTVTRQLQRLKALPSVPRPTSYVLDDDGYAATSADLGLRLVMHDGFISVVSVLPGTSSYEAGVCAGDRLLAINGKTVLAAIDDVRRSIIDLVRAGQSVTLRVRRGDRDLKLTCAAALRVTAMPLTHMDGTVGYITNDRFCSTDNGVYQIWRALLEMRDRGMRSVVFDLRDAHYGKVEHVAKLLGYFMERGAVVTHAWDNTAKVDVIRADGDGTFRDIPVTVIVNQATTGAAEIFAAAMQRRGNAVVIGGRTAGMLHERRELALSATLGVRYVWRRFADVQDTAVMPDIMVALPLHSPTYVVLTPALHRDIMKWRTHEVPGTTPALVDLLQRVTERIPNVPRHAIATSVFGEGARLYVLAEALREMVP